MTPHENYQICVWPQGSWCYSHSLESIQRDSALSDDYHIANVSVCESVIDVDAYIDDLVCNGAL